MINMLFDFIRSLSGHFYHWLKTPSPSSITSSHPGFPASTLELLRWSASIRSADTAQRFLGHYGGRAGEVGQEKQVMRDWRLKYFINQCCGQCVVWWLVENSGNPSFQPSTGIQDSPQVLHVMPLFLYFQGWALALWMFSPCPVCLLSARTFNLSVEEMCVIKRTVSAWCILFFPCENQTHKQRKNNTREH